MTLSDTDSDTNNILIVIGPTVHLLLLLLLLLFVLLVLISYTMIHGGGGGGDGSIYPTDADDTLIVTLIPQPNGQLLIVSHCYHQSRNLVVEISNTIITTSGVFVMLLECHLAANFNRSILPD